MIRTKRDGGVSGVGAIGDSFEDGMISDGVVGEIGEVIVDVEIVGWVVSKSSARYIGADFTGEFIGDDS